MSGELPFTGFVIPGGGGGGVAGLTSANGGTALSDNTVVRGDGTTGIQGSLVSINDSGQVQLVDQQGIRLGTDATTIKGNDSQDRIEITVNSIHVADIGSGGIALDTGSNPSIKWGSGGGFDTGLARNAAAVIKPTDGSTGLSWFMGDAGKTRLAANHTVATDSTSLAAINNLTCSVAAGRHYRFRASLYFTTVDTSGVKVAISGTATHTDIVYDVVVHGISTPGFLTSGRATAKDTAIGVTASGTSCRVDIEGFTTINAAGTLLVQAAQNAETGAAESVIALRGCSFEVTDFA